MSFFQGGSTFGAPQQPGFPTFQGQAGGAAPASAFGNPSFAQPNAQAFGAQGGMGVGQGFGTPAQSVFGNPAASAFGQPAALAFGAQPNAQAFGAQGLGPQGFVTPAPNNYGAQPSGFGQAAAATAFGAPAQPAGFGAQAFPAQGFAAPAPASGFPAQGSGFAGAAATSFGAPSFGGAPASGAYTAPGFGAAAGAATFNSGGGASFQTQTFGVQSNPKQPGDKGEIINSICASMKDQSLESQRVSDYRTGNKGGLALQGPTGFGASVAVAQNQFGQTQNQFGQSAFPQTGFPGQQQSTVAFAQQQQQQQKPAGLGFNASPFAPAAATANVGQSLFGQSQAANTFGQSQATNLFGASSGAAPALFGSVSSAPAAFAPSNFGLAGQQAPFAPSAAAGVVPNMFGGGGVFAAPSTGAFANPASQNAFQTSAFAPALGANAFGNLAANPPAPAAAAPVSAPPLPAQTTEAKYADVFSSRIELEDREGGHRHDSAVYARHHNIAVPRDQPPTLIWQTTAKSSKAGASRNPGSSTPRYSNRSLVDSTPGRDAASLKDVSRNSKALQLLHRSILPAWNQAFFSGKSKAEVQENRELDRPDPKFNSHIKFSLDEKHPLKFDIDRKPSIPNFPEHFEQKKDIKEYYLVAECTAMRFSVGRVPKEVPVPVKLRMTVEDVSFSTLLNMIVRKYGSKDFSDEAVKNDLENGSMFFPFDIHFEYETPFDPTNLDTMHLPKFEPDISDDTYDAEKFDKNYANLLTAAQSGCQVYAYGFPDRTLRPERSGKRHVFGSLKNELEDTDLRADLLKNALQQQTPHANIPRLCLSFGYSSKLDEMHDHAVLSEESTMDLQFIATFDRKKLEEFDSRFRDQKDYLSFLHEFHEYFENQMRSSSFGDWFSEEKHRPVHPLEPMGPKIGTADRFIHVEPSKGNIVASQWRFWVTQARSI